MRFTGVIFDLDGTLIDRADGIFASFASAFRACACTPMRLFEHDIIGPPLLPTLIKLSGSTAPQQSTRWLLLLRPITTLEVTSKQKCLHRWKLCCRDWCRSGCRFTSLQISGRSQPIASLTGRNGAPTFKRSIHWTPHLLRRPQKVRFSNTCCRRMHCQQKPHCMWVTAKTMLLRQIKLMHRSSMLHGVTKLKKLTITPATSLRY